MSYYEWAIEQLNNLNERIDDTQTLILNALCKVEDDNSRLEDELLEKSEELKNAMKFVDAIANMDNKTPFIKSALCEFARGRK